MDATGEFRDHVLPALTFRGRNPGIFKAPFIDAGHGHEPLEQFQPATGIEIALGIMAVTGMAAGHQHTVRAVHERADNEQRIDTAGTGNPDDAQIRGLGKTPNTRRIRATVGAPVTQEAYYS